MKQNQNPKELARMLGPIMILMLAGILTLIIQTWMILFYAISFSLGWFVCFGFSLVKSIIKDKEAIKQ